MTSHWIEPPQQDPSQAQEHKHTAIFTFLAFFSLNLEHQTLCRAVCQVFGNYITEIKAQRNLFPNVSFA